MSNEVMSEAREQYLDESLDYLVSTFIRDMERNRKQAELILFNFEEGKTNTELFLVDFKDRVKDSVADARWALESLREYKA